MSAPEPAAAGTCPGSSDANPITSDWFDRPGFIVFVAALMGSFSLSIDLCVPALASIARAFALNDTNTAQSVITVFVLSFGASHLFQGLLADRFGRKPVLLFNLGLYGVGSIGSALAGSFEMLLLARALQGVAAAGCRVTGTALLRDVKDGGELARSMSLTMVIFTAIPVAAPFIGQALVTFINFRTVFLLPALLATVLAVVAIKSLQETLPPNRRIKLEIRSIAKALWRLSKNADTVIYTAVGGILYGLMFGYLSSAPQIYSQVFGVGAAFPILLSSVAVSMGLAAYLNSRIVETFGAKRMVLLALLLLTLTALGLLFVASRDAPDLYTFHFLILMVLFANGLAYANCNVIAIQPHRGATGLASSMVGGMTMVLSGTITHFIGRAFDGSILPLAEFFCALSILALILERSAMFVRRQKAASNLA